MLSTATSRQREAYERFLEKELPRPCHDPTGPLVIDLLSGCGGLALGFEAAGFQTVGYEMSPAFLTQTVDDGLDLVVECHDGEARDLGSAPESREQTLGHTHESK